MSTPARCGCTCARRPPAGLRRRSAISPNVEARSAEIVGSDQIDVVLDNIGLPYSGINIALSDSATVGPMDGEILVSLKEKHTPDGRVRRGEIARGFCRSVFPTCSSSSSPPTSSIRC